MTRAAMYDMSFDELMEAGAKGLIAPQVLETVLDHRWGATKAVLVVDMCGFSQLSVYPGIATALIQIWRMRQVGEEVVKEYGGELIKVAADNVYATFPSVTSAELAALSFVSKVPCSCGIGFGRLILPPGDIWGVEMNEASKLGEDEAQYGQILYTTAARMVH